VPFPQQTFSKGCALTGGLLLPGRMSEEVTFFDILKLRWFLIGSDEKEERT